MGRRTARTRRRRSEAAPRATRPEQPAPIDDTIDGPDPLQARQKIQIKLAEGKERELEHTQRTTFWSADGQPIAAEEFIEQLFGDIPELFKDEAELRLLWSQPDTRKSLLTGLAEKGYGDEQLQARAHYQHRKKRYLPKNWV